MAKKSQGGRKAGDRVLVKKKPHQGQIAYVANRAFAVALDPALKKAVLKEGDEYVVVNTGFGWLKAVVLPKSALGEIKAPARRRAAAQPGDATSFAAAASDGAALAAAVTGFTAGDKVWIRSSPGSWFGEVEGTFKSYTDSTKNTALVEFVFEGLSLVTAPISVDRLVAL